MKKLIQAILPLIGALFACIGCAHAPMNTFPTQDPHLNAAISDVDRIDGKAIVVEKWLMSTK